MSDEATHCRWSRPVVHSADIDPARARAIEEHLARLKQPKPRRATVWRLPAPCAVAQPASGPFQVLLEGRVLFERGTLREAAKAALSLRGCMVRRGTRTWGREELREMGSK